MSSFSYRARPAKDVQRRMLVAACRRLTPFGPLTDYGYVGFGGVEFIDFSLFRRELGITKMTSIEKDTNRQPRYEFNRPFAGIDVRGGRASQHLPEIDLSGLQIIWLDYEQALDDEVLDDAVLLSRKLQPGSVMAITVNAQPSTPRDARRETLVKNVGEDRVPLGVDDDALARWGLAAVQYRILRDAVVEAFRDRADGAELQQLFNFRYADDAQMQTFGGVVLSAATRRTFELCRFEDLDEFIREGDEPLYIRVPVLTPKELIHLNQQLPLSTGEQLQAEGLSETERGDYERLYRWYPANR